MRTRLFRLVPLALLLGGAALAQAPGGAETVWVMFLLLGGSVGLFGAFVAGAVAFLKARWAWLTGSRTVWLAGALSFLGAFALHSAGVISDPEVAAFRPPWSWIAFGAFGWLAASGGSDYLRQLLRPRLTSP